MKKLLMRVNGRSVWADFALPGGRKRQVQKAKVEPPYDVVAYYRSVRPLFEYSNGVISASFEKAELWRENGQWAGFYIAVVTNNLESWTERYVVQRDGRGNWHNLRQFGVRGPRRRFLGVR